MKTITIINEIKGCYGQRIYIPASNKELVNLFDAVSIWRQGEKCTEEGREIIFELPIGMNIKNNPLIIYALNKNGYYEEPTVFCNKKAEVEE